MMVEAKQELAKLHCIQHLFGASYGSDPYLLAHLKEAIDQCLDADPASHPITEFAEAAMRLYQSRQDAGASRGLFHLDLTRTGYEPLFIHQELVRGLKKICGYEVNLVVVSGLHQIVSDGGKKLLTRRQKDRFEAARCYIDDLCGQWTTEQTRLHIIYV